jgi:hypothetical protein
MPRTHTIATGCVLREVDTWAGGGDEELLAYDAQRGR